MGHFLLDQNSIAQLAKAIARELAEEFKTPIPAAASNPGVGLINLGRLMINLDRHEVILDNELVDLKPREFAVLALLAANAGHVFTRRQLLELAWPADVAVYVDSDRTVDVHIHRIRLKLGASAKALIRTISGVGYKLQASVLEP